MKFKQPNHREYPAKVMNCHDADTITCMVDLGLETYKLETIRLAHIDAPELSTKEGQEAAKFLQELLLSREVNIITLKKEKFGRRLAEVYIISDTGGINVNRLMVTKGYAKEYEGGKRG